VSLPGGCAIGEHCGPNIKGRTSDGAQQITIEEGGQHSNPRPKRRKGDGAYHGHRLTVNGTEKLMMDHRLHCLRATNRARDAARGARGGRFLARTASSRWRAASRPRNRGDRRSRRWSGCMERARGHDRCSSRREPSSGRSTDARSVTLMAEPVASSKRVFDKLSEGGPESQWATTPCGLR